MMPDQPLLTRMSLGVTCAGETVTITVGDVPIPMHYEQAVDLSRWILEECRDARRRSAQARRVRIAPYRVPPSQQPLTHKGGGEGASVGAAIHVKDRLATWDREDVSLGRGGVVLLRFKAQRRVMGLPLKAAMILAHWLRVKSRECRTFVEDDRLFIRLGRYELSTGR